MIRIATIVNTPTNVRVLRHAHTYTRSLCVIQPTEPLKVNMVCLRFTNSIIELIIIIIIIIIIMIKDNTKRMFRLLKEFS
jgi:hypothetical protein